ncbi:hypothetical protein PQR70_14170 [Paraburkholderia madseniana]|uniref:hypothetical protein n=1 Tax=Paraburkholderia madseniana TaxID=2599607 RepID=UPI0038B9CC46
MNLRTLFGWASIVVSTAMPFTVVNMTSAYVDNAFAMARVSGCEIDVLRLSQLYGDIRSLPAGNASTLLSRHGLTSIEAMHQRLDVAQANFLLARTEAEKAGRRVWRDSAVGFLCIAVTSWAALALATVWPRRRRTNTAVAV